MKLYIENCDFYEDSLSDVMFSLRELLDKEDRNFEDTKKIKNILDDLDSFNLSFILEEVDNIVYTMLLSMKKVCINEIENNEISFKELNFPNEDIQLEYERLLTQFVHLRKQLKEEYKFSDKEIEYIEPNSKLYNIRVSVSIKDLLQLLLTCSQYDETIDVVVSFSDYDNLMELMVTIALSLSDIMKNEDLFIRIALEEETKKNMTASNELVFVLSNEDYLKYCMENLIVTKISVVGGCSLVAYKELLTRIPRNEIKIENFKTFVKQKDFSISLPAFFSSINDELMNEIDRYLYDWYLLVDAFVSSEDYNSDAILCCLGCFINIFKLNTPITNINVLDVELNEVEEIMEAIMNKVII